MCRLLTPQLEEVLKDYPLYSQDGKGKEAVCRAVFVFGSARWYILEGNHEGDDFIMFAIVVGLFDDEYGYVSLKELSDVVVEPGFRVRQLNNFEPTRLKNIPDSRLQAFLARFEEEEDEDDEE